MNNLVEKLTGMDKMSDEVIAYDFLTATKSGVKNYAKALTEAATPEVRNLLKRQLYESIAAYEAISSYMIKKGYYHAYKPIEQFDADLKASDKALNLT